MKIITYQSTDPLREEIDGQEGNFLGEGTGVAEDRATAFWNDAKAKAAAKKERGRKLSMRIAA